jgi:hypothetical protein
MDTGHCVRVVFLPRIVKYSSYVSSAESNIEDLSTFFYSSFNGY